MNEEPVHRNHTLSRIERVRVFEQAVEQIRDLIFDGTFGAGEKLPAELELSRQLNVGRSSIREALRVLEAEGLIEVRRGAGAYVSLEDERKVIHVRNAGWLLEREGTLTQILQVRESIEGLTAAQAASLAEPASLRGIRGIVEQQATIVTRVTAHADDAIKEMANLDCRFHLEISGMSGNDIADDIVSHVVPAFVESNKAILQVSGRAEVLVRDHQLILAAIEAKNPIEAEATMRAHIRRVLDEIRALRKDKARGS